MANNNAATKPVHEIIRKQLKKERDSPNSNFDTALLNFHKFKAQVDDFVQECSKLDEETRYPTFGREEDYEAFKKATETALVYHKNYIQIAEPMVTFFHSGEGGDWFRCQLEGCRIFLQERIINKICEAREKQYGEGDAMKKWAELPLAERPHMPYWEV